MIVDAFTRIVKIYPCKTTNSLEVIKHLTDYFNYYSRPKVLVSDRGSGFRSHEFTTYLENEGVKHILVATGCPRANGQVERMNRFLTPVLSKIAYDKNCEWDNIVSDVEFVFNNTINRSINTSPCKLLFGRNQRNVECDELTSFLERNNFGKICIESIRDQAISKNKTVQNYNKTHYDSKCKSEAKYEQGEYVMIRNVIGVGEDKKLAPKFKGPYYVKKVLPNNRYLLADVEGFQLTQLPFEGVFDPSNMKPWLHCTQDDLIENVESDDQNEEVEPGYNLRHHQDGRAVVDRM